ncbi:tetratricopeptide repeat protein [Thermosipho ferrireducens]|uniref:Tetratricopeptide repeat protein n=2 Tax=Thermosipho ferrireducens TaxID=2571116 RepID=A0ABX7SBJ5_9BACT|nr:tetratricopeptide repeat protein [Thermosipho ferrireducens]
MNEFLKAIEFTKLGEYEKAIEIYQQLAAKNIPEAYNNLGNIYRKKGLIGKAVEMYKKAININPEFPEAFFNMGCALMEIDKYDEAIMALEKSQKLGLHSFDLDVQLALCYIATGKQKKAQEKLSDKNVENEVKKYLKE